MHRVNAKKIQWPARRIAIGDTISERIIYRVGTQQDLGKMIVKISSIVEDEQNNSYIISVSTLDNPEEEMVWKTIKNPSKMVEIEYDIDSDAYPEKV